MGAKFKKNRILPCFFIAFLLFGIASFAQENDLAVVYGQIDAAFAANSAEDLDSILSSKFGTEYYSLYESYALKKTRRLIISGDLEMARAATLVVIDNNLENFDAVELYSYIDKAILNAEATRAAEENRKRLEAERIAAENEKTKTRLKSTYSTTESSSGKEVYKSETQSNFSPVRWNISLGIADFLIQTISGAGTSVKYGLMAELDLIYTGEKFIIGGDLGGNFEFLSFKKENKDTFATAKLIPKIAFQRLNKHFFLRLGFGAFFAIKSNDPPSNAIGTMLSPIFGLGWENAKIGNAVFKATIDYCLGHLALEDAKAAIDGAVSIMFPLSNSEHTKVGVKIGIDDLLFIKSGGVENRCNAIFAIGVGNVDR